MHYWFLSLLPVFHIHLCGVSRIYCWQMTFNKKFNQLTWFLTMCTSDRLPLVILKIRTYDAFSNYLHYISYANIFIRFHLDGIFQSAIYKNTKNLEVRSRNTTLTGEYIIIQNADQKQSWIEWKPNTFTLEGNVNWKRQCKFQITTIVNELIITLKIESTVFHE